MEVFIRAGGRVLLLHSKAVGESRRREENWTLTGLCMCMYYPCSHPPTSSAFMNGGGVEKQG